MTAAAPEFNFVSDTGTGVFRVGAGVLGLTTAGVERARIDSGALTLPVVITGTQPAASSGTPPSAIKSTAGAHTGLSNAEAIDWLFAGNRTVQFADATALATQRCLVINAPTYSSAVATKTITTAATLSISAPPQAGANVTITNPWALDVVAGSVHIGTAGVGLVTAGTIRGPDGTAGAPAYAFSSDSASGLSFSGGTLAVNTGGAARAQVSSAGVTSTVPLKVAATAAADNYLQLANGATAAVGGAALGLLRYNDTTKAIEFSLNAGAWTGAITRASFYAVTPPVTTTPYNVLDGDHLILVDTSTIAITINLPVATTKRELIIVDKSANAATNGITVTPNGAAKIHRVAGSQVINANDGHMRLWSDGTDWWIT